MKSGDPTLQDIEEVPDNFDDPNHHTAISFYYCSDAYGAFLDGVDDFKEQDQFVEDRYGAHSPLYLRFFVRVYLSPIFLCSKEEREHSRRLRGYENRTTNSHNSILRIDRETRNSVRWFIGEY